LKESSTITSSLLIVLISLSIASDAVDFFDNNLGSTPNSRNNTTNIEQPILSIHFAIGSVFLLFLSIIKFSYDFILLAPKEFCLSLSARRSSCIGGW
jgi:hypothetical protein